jgi:hypothetical protein
MFGIVESSFFLECSESSFSTIIQTVPTPILFRSIESIKDDANFCDGYCITFHYRASWQKLQVQGEPIVEYIWAEWSTGMYDNTVHLLASPEADLTEEGSGTFCSAEWLLKWCSLTTAV